MNLTAAPDLATIVQPAWFVADGLHVVEGDVRLDEPMRAAADAMRRSTGRADVVAAVRTMYKRVGLDPTRTRPSSEALLRRVRKGGELPRINTVVDVINWCSLETQLPFGLYDAERIQGDVVLRLGREGEEYAGIRKDVVHLAGRLTLADEAGPFGNPTSDSARTMVTTSTVRALVVIFVPGMSDSGLGAGALELTRERLGRYAASAR